MLNAEQLVGIDQSHLIEIGQQRLERRCAKAFIALQHGAADAGFDIKICSGWRSFERQLAIFNGKAQGKRPLNNRQGELCSAEQMSDADLLDAILAWSALPGGSRHHWGTDVDIYDAKQITLADLALEPWEYQQGGPNHALSQWLDANMAAYGFFRPYQQELGGVAPELWHLSYAPVAANALEQLSLSLLEKTLTDSDISLKATILAQLPGLIERYCYRISSP
ncbi:M15 family metallopeptidase [Ferrimonas lipolytica]|uniref:M15 family metallopeptidase n=1 Tax=Ferrimonas lipolytica TaxID=2724191 RepID=A0A6H1UCT6_9GAMM|nr:M15 family metallopeptidase [Ferrimonas lipolytica]QIZ76881.1 M15 family metallopeptidase [Ferrimonas lipolytica]